jgi:cytochrome c oxidase subunit 2
MHSYVVVQTPQEFEQWVAKQRVGSPLIDQGVIAAAPVDSSAPADTTAAVRDPLIARGGELFITGGCVGCHAMVGQPTAGVLNLTGPNLSHFGSRTRIAAGILANTDENLARWLRNPQEVKLGALMTLPRQLTEDEVTALVAYLRSHQ